MHFGVLREGVQQLQVHRGEGGDAEDADAFGQQAVGRGLEGLFEPVPHFYAVGRGLAVV